MGKKYKAKKKYVNEKNKDTGIQKEPPIIGKGKILLLLVVGTFIVAGFYIAAMKNEWKMVFHAYIYIATILLCVFIFMKRRNEYLHEKALAEGIDKDKEHRENRKRLKKEKYLLLVLMPFLFTIIADTVYLLILKDLKFFDAINQLLN